MHICLTGPYTPKFSYQENLLTKYHKKMGADVYILANEEMYEKSKIIFSKLPEFINEDDIPVSRLPYLKWIPLKLNQKLRIYPDVYEKIKGYQPDVIFVHDVQFLSILQVVKYAKENPYVKIFVDGHADFSNSARTFVSKNILHRIIYRYCAKKILPYTTKFWGTLPARVDFFHDVYGIPKEKIDFLPMGADDELVEKKSTPEVRSEYRKKYGILDDDILLVTGGKIDLAKKQTLLLMDAVNQIENKKLKLIFFGSIAPELKDDVEKRYSEKVKYIGWLSSEESYPHFAMADLVVFPGRHSVFWEQVAGQGIPMIVKYWPGTTHVDRGGNVKFIYKDSVKEIKKLIEQISLKDEIAVMKDFSKKNKDFFLYSSIAKKALMKE